MPTKSKRGKSHRDRVLRPDRAGGDDCDIGIEIADESIFCGGVGDEVPSDVLGLAVGLTAPFL